MKKVMKSESWRHTELFFTNQEEKEAEKKEFMEEFESIWNETLGKIEGICLYFTSARRDNIPDEEYHHKPLSEIKELFLKELSDIYDSTRFFRVEVRKPGGANPDSLELVLWVQITDCSQNGHAVYVRFCTTKEYNDTKKSLEEENVPQKIKDIYLEKLEETFFVPDAESIKKSVQTEIKDMISEAIYEVEDDWCSYLSLKREEALESILEVLEEKTLYQTVRDIIVSKYVDDDTIEFAFENGEEILKLQRQEIVTHEYVW